MQTKRKTVEDIIQGAKTESPKIQPVKNARVNRNFEVDEDDFLEAKAITAKAKIHLWEIWGYLLNYYKENYISINQEILKYRNQDKKNIF